MSTKTIQPLTKLVPESGNTNVLVPRFKASDLAVEMAATSELVADVNSPLRLNALKFGTATKASIAASATVTISSMSVKPAQRIRGGLIASRRQERRLSCHHNLSNPLW